jgi:exodeoxyribonuclease VII large subunit
METMSFGVSGAIAVLNQTLEYAYPTMTVVGEVANFKVNQGKWVFFDLKDDESSVGCFLPLANLRVVLEDGMKVQVLARPRLTKWGKFSLTVEKVQPIGEGSIKKAFELLREKLTEEGLFAPERKRALSLMPERIGVVSSEGAAGYKDFIKILGERWGGVEILLYQAQVQGIDAPEQLSAGIEFFNEAEEPPEVICLLRGGGSRDDLVAFDDEELVRKIAGSRVPILAGIGHEVDTTLADLAADVRASTPSNAAEILVSDKKEVIARVKLVASTNLDKTVQAIDSVSQNIVATTEKMQQQTIQTIQKLEQVFEVLKTGLEQLNPQKVLARGYALVRNTGGQLIKTAEPGEEILVENDIIVIKAEVKNVKSKND